MTTRYLLFYRWHGISMRETQANSFEEAKRKAEELMRILEPKEDPIEEAYLVVDWVKLR